jgi:uncharacterized protein YjiS (DUF1127 family)
MREKSMLSNYSANLADGAAELSGASNERGSHFGISDRRASAALAQENLAGIEQSQLANLLFAGGPPHRSATFRGVFDPIVETVLRKNTASLERYARLSAMGQEYGSAPPESAPLLKPHGLPGSGWLTWSWQRIAHRWMHWCQEQRIKRTVAALAQFDDRILWDVGIPERSQIEEVVRHCRDG